MRNPSVFISYSWDNDDHKRWVRELAERLVTNGVVVRLDQWDVQPGDSLTAFMEQQVAICDRTLVICTPNYATKSVERKGGVGYEQQIISGHIAGGVERRRFIPVVRQGSFEPGSDCAIPLHFLGTMAIDLRDSPNFEAAFEVLLRAIFKNPAAKAPMLGSIPNFETSEDRPSRTLRLPSLELDGWELRSGVVSAESYPDTFHIPSDEERANVKRGDVVKLQFEVAVESEENVDETELWGERMWVVVKGHVGPYLWGLLNNVPSFEDGHPDLKVESEIIFLPEHIIDIA